jgi:hypothetical protein
MGSHANCNLCRWMLSALRYPFRLVGGNVNAVDITISKPSFV